MKKVVVGMSGGVDSSVCAYLLKEKGYEVIGVTLRMWEDDEEVCRRGGHVGCCGKSAVEDAMRICANLGISYHTHQQRELFAEKVVDPFCNNYLNGATPNPCIECNRYLKWGAMLEFADKLGADYIATGHYAKVLNHNGRYTIQQSDDLSKDQSYVLYQLTQDQLARTLFPLGGYNKDEVRKIAREAGIIVADKKDSQDICFIPDGDYASFIEKRIGSSNLPQSGDFVDADGNVLGTHDGFYHYTYGQRKGLGIALGKPVFVTDIDTEKNTVTLGDNEDCFTGGLIARDICHMAEAKFGENDTYIAKIRYSDRGSKCHVRYDGDNLIVEFEEKARAVTPGQAVVLYKEKMVAGGATIVSRLD